MSYAFHIVYNMQKFYLAAVLLGAVILTTVLTVYLYCTNIPPERKNMLLMLQAAILVIQAGQFLTVVAPPAKIDLFIKVQGIGLCLVGLPFFGYCYAAARKGCPKIRQGIVLCLLPAAGVALLLTNSTHQLFYTIYDTFYFSFGQAYNFVALYNYLLALSGLYLIYVSQGKNPVLKQGQFAAAVMAVLVVVLIDVYEYAAAISLSLYDLTPAGFSIAQAAYLLGSRQAAGGKTLLKIRMNTLDCLNQSIVITDSSHTVLYFNKSPLNTLLKVQEEKDFTAILAPVSELPQDPRDSRLREFALESPELPAKKHYSYYARPIAKNSHTQGVLHSFRDISEDKAMIEQLDCRNKELAAVTEQLQKHADVVKRLAEETERRLLIRHVNNTAGQTMARIIINLEALDDIKGQEAQEKICQSIDCARNGIRKIRAAVAELSSWSIKEEQ